MQLHKITCATQSVEGEGTGQAALAMAGTNLLSSDVHED